MDVADGRSHAVFGVDDDFVGFDGPVAFLADDNVAVGFDEVFLADLLDSIGCDINGFFLILGGGGGLWRRRIDCNGVNGRQEEGPKKQDDLN